MSGGRVDVASRVAATRLSSIGELPGLKWWVEPDGIVTTTAVDSWTDKSGNGNTISETLTNRPTLASAVLDGYDGVTFLAANSQRLKKVNTPLLTTGQVSFGLVMRVNAIITNSRFFCNSVSSTNGLEFCDASNTFSPTYAGLINQTANAIVTGLSSFHIFTFRVAGHSCNGYYRYNRTDTAIASGIGMLDSGATASLIVGASGAAANHSSMTLVAGFLCNAFLTSNQMLVAEEYWKAKYPTLA